MKDNNIYLKEWRQNIIERIAQARAAKGWSQAQLAGSLGTQRSNISRLESGAHNPSLDFLLRVASVLDMEIDVKPLIKEEAVQDSNIYELRLYDEVLLTFILEEKGIEGLMVGILSSNEKRKHLLPLDLTLTDDGILKWLQHRVIPKNRTFVEEILKSLNLSVNNTKGISDVCKGLSLNDSYWIVRLCR
jgi:transcriptional regulator with XRE-family HTH domain